MCIVERQARRHRPRAEHGISLIELIVFIVIVGIAVAGVVGALSMATRSSADPMIQKQALAIAEALLEEVQLQPFTYCDPDDPNAASAFSAADCTGVTVPLRLEFSAGACQVHACQTDYATPIALSPTSAQ